MKDSWAVVTISPTALPSCTATAAPLTLASEGLLTSKLRINCPPPLALELLGVPEDYLDVEAQLEVPLSYGYDWDVVEASHMLVQLCVTDCLFGSSEEL